MIYKAAAKQGLCSKKKLKILLEKVLNKQVDLFGRRSIKAQPYLF